MMNLFVFALPIGTHFGGWRHPDAYADTAMRFDVLVELAKTCERGKLDAFFLADSNGVIDMSKTELFAANTPTVQPAAFEPVVLYAALAQHTKHIGFVATATTTYEEPYLLARKFASLDSLSGGRSVWNIVTTSTAAHSKNFGREANPDATVRYDRAREFVQVVKGLWDSWAEDAFVQDKASGRFLDPARVSVLNHHGTHFSVSGPLNAARSPQGQPILCSAGQSEPGKELAAAVAEVLFATTLGKDVAQREYADVKARMAKYGRAPDELRVMPQLAIYVAPTRAEADRYYEECQSLIPTVAALDYVSNIIHEDLTRYPLDGPFPQLDELGQGTSFRRIVADTAKRQGLTVRQTCEMVVSSAGGPVVKGTAVDVADVMQDWYESKAADGFMLMPPTMPRGIDAIVDLLVPELQRRGLFRKDYEGTTLREVMGLKIPRNPNFP